MYLNFTIFRPFTSDRFVENTILANNSEAVPAGPDPPYDLHDWDRQGRRWMLYTPAYSTAGLGQKADAVVRFAPLVRLTPLYPKVLHVYTRTESLYLFAIILFYAVDDTCFLNVLYIRSCTLHISRSMFCRSVDVVTLRPTFRSRCCRTIRSRSRRERCGARSRRSSRS